MLPLLHCACEIMLFSFVLRLLSLITDINNFCIVITGFGLVYIKKLCCLDQFTEFCAIQILWIKVGGLFRNIRSDLSEQTTDYDSAGTKNRYPDINRMKKPGVAMCCAACSASIGAGPGNLRRALLLCPPYTSGVHRYCPATPKFRSAVRKALAGLNRASPTTIA